LDRWLLNQRDTSIAPFQTPYDSVVCRYINSRHAPRISAAVPVHTPLQEKGQHSSFLHKPMSKTGTRKRSDLTGSRDGTVPNHGSKRKGLGTHINHCRVENLTDSTRSLSPATSCSIRASVSLIRISWPFASSLMRPFSRFRSSLTEACVREISSRNREDNFARSDVSLSCDERVSCDSVESEFISSERNLAKSTFCVYVLRSASR
jgi:hypothetical protein